jgi:hypothetical protein
VSLCIKTSIIMDIEREQSNDLPKIESATFFPNCRNNECIPPIKNQKEF